MINLLRETVEVLGANDKKLEDVKWIGIPGFGTIDIEVFKYVADKEYDNGFGGEEVNLSLVVVGDSWWLERHEYDGSEWWEYKELPKKPDANNKIDIWDTRW